MREKATQRENSGYMKSVEGLCIQQYTTTKTTTKNPKQKQNNSTQQTTE